MNITPKERVLHALKGQQVDKVPFTVYENKLPQCQTERELRNMGLCIINRTINVIKVHQPDVRTTTKHYTENGKRYIRTDIETPVGNLHSIVEDQGWTRWTHKHLFTRPEDYKPLIFIVENERYEPNYDAFVKAQELAGGDVLYRGGIGSEPLQVLISYFMGTETFCFEWMERRDEVMKLYDALVSAARRRYELIAQSPALFFNYGGNVTVEIIGPKVYEQMYIPHYREAAEIFHKYGKLIGSHYDGNCRQLAQLIAKSGLDYIEAFTPAPDTDMTLEQAIQAWPDKCLWINFPSSVHLYSDDKIANVTRELLDAGRNHNRFIMGITEDVPENRWQASFKVIMQTIDEYFS